MNDDRAQLRRWSYSAAVAVVVHGGMVAAVLNWRMAIAPLNLTGFPPPAAVIIDLAPLPAAPRPLQSPAQPASAFGRAAGPPAKEITEEKTAPNGEKNAEPAAAPAATTAPVAFAPAQNGEGEDSAQTRSASGGGGVSPAAPSNGRGGNAIEASHMDISRVDPGPIDTTVTVQPVLHPRKAARVIGQNRIILLRPSRHPGEREPFHNLSATSGTATNPPGFHIPGTQVPGTHAPGAHVQDRARAAMAREIHPADGRSAIGGAAATSIVVSSRNAIGGAATTSMGRGNSPNAVVIAKNAVGMTIQLHPSIPSMNNGERKTGPIASTATAPANGIINGHDIVRPGTRPGVIGGPAKTVAGGINGTDFHPRHP